MSKILYRYFFHQFILPFIFIALFLMVFLMSFQLFKVLGGLISKDVPAIEIFNLFFNLGVSFLPLSIPMACFFATLSLWSKFSDHSELVAMRAIGFSPVQKTLPLLAMVFLIAVSIFSLTSNVIPHSQKQVRQLIALLGSRGLLSDIRPGQFFTQIPSVVLFAEEISGEQDNQVLSDIFIQTSENGTDQVITAKSAKFLKLKDFTLGVSFIEMELKQGSLIQIQKEKNDVSKILFDQYQFKISTEQFALSTISKESTKSFKELWREYNTLKSEIEKSKIMLELCSRLNYPLQCILLTLLATLIGQNFKPRQNSSLFLRGIIYLIGYYLLFFAALSLVKKNLVNPAIGILLPSVVIIMIIPIKIYRSSWFK